MINLLWLQGQSCGGDTMSFLNSESPDITELADDFNINVVWHPTLSLKHGEDVLEIVNRFCRGEKLDILVVEGAISRGPNDTGVFDTLGKKPFKDIVKSLAKVANYVIAAGTCASWGGIPATGPNPTDATGLQFHKNKRGGFLGTDFKSRGGFPVINIPGCPAHPQWIIQTIIALALGRADQIELDDYQRPTDFYGTLSHEGCNKTLYHEYKMAAENFGDRGCLFYELGCRGPITYSSCNHILWNSQSSKPRAGIPCIGCTEPEFPDYPEPGFFRRYAITPALGIRALPYLISTPFAKLVAPEILKRRIER